MADSLLELLVPHIKERPVSRPPSNAKDAIIVKYLSRLSTLQLESLKTTEPQSLEQAHHSALLSLQSLCSRSSKALIVSTDHLAELKTSLPAIAKDVGRLRDAISTLDKEAVSFSSKYSRSGENEVLDRRKKALLLSRNVERLSDILDLPTLLSSTISSNSSSGMSSTTMYASALDLHSHIKRLHMLYQDSEILKSIYIQAEEVMREMTSNLIASLRAQNIKLAAGMRTVGWLRRIAPELEGLIEKSSANGKEGSLGALFLVCRLANFVSMLGALDPLRELADQETDRRLNDKNHIPSSNAWSGGQQTERFLKRYIEIFREQSFAIISMFRSIFPPADATADYDIGAQFRSLGLKSAPPERTKPDDDPMQPLPSALSTFPLHLVGLLSSTLRQYLPNVRDKSSRESLLTQVLYCANSLGRLGGDFSIALAGLGLDDSSDDEDEEWIGVMKKHRMLAGRLELLASGVAGGKKT
ncbi:MAG: hypothetical protein MMC33_002520 [Icmadophila ericetorum]|nr:hypothetical protein [Icmadophila ericetorum]